LTGYNIFLNGEFSIDKDKMIEYIISHSGLIVKRFDIDKVTHVLEGDNPKKSKSKKAMEFNIPIIDEKILKIFVEDSIEKQQEVIQSQTMSQGDNDELKVETIKSMRNIKGANHFIVTYKGLSPDYEDTISRERAIELCSEEKIIDFEKKKDKEIKKFFSSTASEKVFEFSDGNSYQKKKKKKSKPKSKKRKRKTTDETSDEEAPKKKVKLIDKETETVETED